MAGKEMDTLKNQFNQVLEKIKLTNQDECNHVLTDVFPKVIEKLKNADCLFKKMYKTPVYTGSYYEKLRIKDACEFDINLVLEIPCKAVKVDASVNPQSYALLQLEKRVEEITGLDEKEKHGLKSLLDDKNFVIPRNLISWMQRVIDKADLRSITANKVKEIKFTSSGPARTLLIVLNGIEATEISVDLVPVFRFPYAEWPKSLKNLRQSIVSKDKSGTHLYLVPKSYARGPKQIPNEPTKADMPRIWRMNFAGIERGFLENNIEARPVIKILKLLRDCQGWWNLHSYFLKTLVLNEIADNPKKEWSQKALATNVLEMMEKLSGCVQKQRLPHFFFSSVNMFQYLGATEMDNIKNRLKVISKKIKEDPNSVPTFFKA